MRIPKLFTTLAACVLGLGTLQAQTILWGAGHSNPYIDSVGTFASSNASLTVLGWQSTTTSTPTGASWTYTTTGISAGVITSSWLATGNTSTMTSPSIANGAAIFDSETIDATVPSPHNATLRSPMIDLSAAAGKEISVRFYTNYFDFRTTEFSVGISVDSGTTWQNANIFNTSGASGIRAAFNSWVQIPLRNALDTPSTQDFTKCFIRFVFNGDYYFFALDDISIVETPEFDVAIGVPTVGNTLGNSLSTYRISNNYYQPLNQASNEEYGFSASVKNLGSRNLLAGDSANLKVFVDFESAPNTWTLAKSDTVFLDTISVDNDTIPSVNFTPSWLPTQVGRYRVTYVVGVKGLDGNMRNDSARHIFNISNNDYYSKVPKNSVDGYPASTNRTFPAAGTGNLVADFEYGSLFFFPNGATDSMQLDSVSFRMHATSLDTPTFTGGTVQVRLYTFKDGRGGGTVNGHIDNGVTNNELALVAVGAANVTGTSGYRIASTKLEDVNTQGDYRFQDTTFYLVSLVQSNAAGINTAAGRFRAYWVGHYDLNYGLNASINSAAAPSPVRTKIITNAGASVSNDWNWIGFGADQVPSIGLHLSKFRNGVAVQELTEKAAQISVFPNPTKSVLNIQSAFETSMQVVSYHLVDMNGQVIMTKINNNVQTETVSFDVANLPAGVYMVAIQTEKGISTRRFVKQ
jgi:Secretion system C-terminal sorting domain